MVRLNPSQTLCDSADGRVLAMVEVLFLHACQVQASQLKFRTQGDELRIAEIIDGELYEFPQPPNCLQSPMLDRLRQLFSISDGQTDAKCEFQLASSTASARIELKSDEGAVVTILRNFGSKTDVAMALQRFWRDNAASQGFLYLSFYYAKEAWWRLCEAASQAMHPRSAV